MILKNALDLSNSIDECRRNIYELTKNKGISDPDVVKVSQKLDGKITMLQKYIYEICSMPKGTSPFQDYKHG